MSVHALMESTRTVLRQAMDERGHELPDLNRIIDAFDRSTPAEPRMGECPVVVHEMIARLPDPEPASLRSLVDALRTCAGELHWVRPYGERAERAGLATQYVATTLVGPGGGRFRQLRDSKDAAVFLTLQAPQLTYPPHHHSPAELYCAVAGTADWQVGDGPFVARPPGSWMVHGPWMFHAMRTRDEPLLALSTWVGELHVTPTFADD